MDIIYNVNSTQPCIAGHQFDNRANRIVFEGFEMRDASNELYLLLENATAKVRVGIVDYTFDVTTPLTVKGGKYNAQLEERTADDSLVAHSDVFTIIFKSSIDADEEYEQTDPRMDTMYEKYNAKYNEVEDLRADLVEKVAEGYFDGKDGIDGADGKDGKDGKDGDNYTITESDYEAIAEKVKPYDDTEIREELAEKVGFEDYASQSKSGVVLTHEYYGNQTSNGYLMGVERSASDFEKGTSDSRLALVSVGTLKNVLAERLKEPQFELIEEIVLTEDVILKRTAEPNGTPYSFKRLTLVIDFSQAPLTPTAQGIYLCINQPSFSYATWFGQVSRYINQPSYCWCECDVTNGLLLGQSMNTVGNESSGSSTITNGVKQRSTMVQKIESVISNTAFPSGTNIKIYGIRA